jgi:hypothetical protein
MKRESKLYFVLMHTPQAKQSLNSEPLFYRNLVQVNKNEYTKTG